MFSTDFNLFHRTRLKDIPNNKVYTWDKFKQLCIDAGLNFKELLKREKKQGCRRSNLRFKQNDSCL